MKGFAREETRFSLCGLNCCLCSMHLGGYCPGCGGGAGNQSCSLAKCSLEHGGLQFCWECPEYPCSRYDDFNDGDSFVPHRNRQQDIAQAGKQGLEAYLAHLEKKRAILEGLLAHYNDGRRKTLFTTAVYLLPLEDLQSVMTALAIRSELKEQPIKERALAAVGLLQEAAEHRGVSLKLNKEPRKG
ncbi:DUF3795 domain-containing protein [Intestinimonas massiliensis (ex Afouda et al. 2020)]|uniref:DUF3795 domain-containing protein n=1 Tax=Intestinimonas massiliensis (ex Afouda et al. 2020) TaxID=1673721 RepID=UPI001031C9FA|nr:DUF3795 domain-containing protein [Intestinimonas massiliensis (ex Afouda et al. 2020)]